MRTSLRALLGRSAFLVAALGTSAVAAAPLPLTRITTNATTDSAPRAVGATLYWVGIDPDGTDTEIFRFDATQPIDPGTPASCPHSNPCQLTENEFDDRFPVAAAGGAAWLGLDLPNLRRSVWVVRGDAAEQIGSVNASVGLAASGKRVAWWGWDLSDASGLYLAELDRPFDAAPAACPATNPCRITSEAPTPQDRSPAVGGSRVVWTDVAAGGTDTEVFVFDADLGADGPPGPCPATNPCRLTDDEVGDAAAVVSASHIAWVSCPDDDCYSAPPDSLHVFDGATTVTLTNPPLNDLFSDWLDIDGTRLTWPVFIGTSMFFDASKPVAAFDAYPLACPDGNPCRLDGATDRVLLVGDRALSTNATDIVGPVELRLFDLGAPLTPWPYAACPTGNPCVLREGIFDWGAFTNELIAWSECSDETNLSCQFDTADAEVYAMPEADAGGAGWLALVLLTVRRAGTARRHRTRHAEEHRCASPD